MVVDPVLMVMGGVFAGVAAFVAFVMSMFTDRRDSELEARLTAFNRAQCQFQC